MAESAFDSHGEADVIRLFPVQDQVKGYMAVLIVSDIVRAVIKITGRAVRHDIAGEPAVYLGIIFDIPVDDKRAVVRQECGELMEGMPDVFQILKEIQMVFFYI